MKKCLNILLVVFLPLLATAANASSKIGILVFDGFLISDVTAPIEVFGAATKKSWFFSYKVMVISATRTKSVKSEEGLRIVADKTIYDDLKLDVLIVPSSYDMGHLAKNQDLVGPSNLRTMRQFLLQRFGPMKI